MREERYSVGFIFRPKIYGSKSNTYSTKITTCPLWNVKKKKKKRKHFVIAVGNKSDLHYARTYTHTHTRALSHNNFHGGLYDGEREVERRDYVRAKKNEGG